MAWEERVARAAGRAVLLLLASPIFAVVGVARVVQLYRRTRIFRMTQITCPAGHVNDLHATALCPQCKRTTDDHRLLCRKCDYVGDFFDCDECGRSIDVSAALK